MSYRPDMAQRQKDGRAALRKADEYVAVHRQKDAVDVLHQFLTSRRYNRQWTQVHEDVAKRFLDLVIELRLAPLGKDGLIHYRNTAQHVAPGSLETVVTYFVDQALAHVAKVRASLRVQDLNDVEDLEEDKSPEELLYSLVSPDDARERAERESLLPWVRFAWDSLKNVLEALKLSKKVERVYHGTAQRCFAFLVDYERRTELHRLCETLRRHLGQVLRSADTSGDGLHPDSIDMHLRTRFVQFSHCAQLKQWNEAFHTMEDLHMLIEQTEHTPKVHMMAAYFQNLATVLWQSQDNQLYHAHAWYRYFCLSIARNTSLTPEQRANMACVAVLSALVVPKAANDRSDAEDYDIELEKDKKERIASLLRFMPTEGRATKLPELQVDANPTRAGLLAELVSTGVMEMVSPEMVGLYRLVEVDFHPLEIVKRVQPMLAWVREQESLAQYADALRTMLVHQVVAQLTTVYRTMHMDRFESLLAPLDLSPADMEKIMVRAVKAHELQVRVDHQSRCLHLGEDAMENDHMRRQLTKLATGLKPIAAKIRPVDVEAEAYRRREVFAAAHDSMYHATDEVQQRIKEIEARKEESEREKERQARAAERERQAQEAQARAAAAELKAQMEEKRRQAAHQALVEEEKKKEEARREQAAEKAKIQLAKQRKQAELAKRRSYLTRALREAEQPLLQRRVEDKVAADAKHHNDLIRNVREKLQADHARSMEVKAALCAALPYRAEFEARVREHTHDEAVRRREEKARKTRCKYLEGKIRRAEARRSQAAAAARVAAVPQDEWRNHARGTGSAAGAGGPALAVPEDAGAGAGAGADDPAEDDGWSKVRGRGSTPATAPAAAADDAGGDEGWSAAGRGGRTGGPAAAGGWRARAAARGDADAPGADGGGGWRARTAGRGGEDDGGAGGGGGWRARRGEARRGDDGGDGGADGGGGWRARQAARGDDGGAPAGGWRARAAARSEGGDADGGPRFGRGPPRGRWSARRDEGGQ